MFNTSSSIPHQSYIHHLIHTPTTPPSHPFSWLQSTKILLVHPKCEIILDLSNLDFLIAPSQVIALNLLWFFASFLDCPHYNYRSSNNVHIHNWKNNSYKRSNAENKQFTNEQTHYKKRVEVKTFAIASWKEQ